MIQTHTATSWTDVKLSTTTKVLAVSTWVILTALSAQLKIPLPFTPVPVTLQTGVVVLGGVMLGKFGFFAQLFYVLLGGIGLPLFAVKVPGSSAIWGPTGGYLIGFILASYLSYRFVHYPWNQLKVTQKFGRLFLISFAIFAPGVTVLAFALDVSWLRALELGFYPFILGDVIKTLLVALTPNALVAKSRRLFS